MVVESLFDLLPASWQVTTLGEVCKQGGGNIQTGPFGSQLHASDYVPVGVPSIMPQDIGDNRIMVDGIARITLDDAKRLSRYLVRTGDIVYSRRGDVERRALIRIQEDGWLCGTGCLRVRLGDGDVDPVYCVYYLGHPDVRAWIVRHAVGATMPNLNTSILSALPLVVPSLHEQRTIASILSALDDKIDLNRRMNETLEAIARALFTSWFVDFDPVRAKMEGRQPVGMDAEIAALLPEGLEESEIGAIPVGWQIAPFSSLATLSRVTINPSNYPSEVFDHYSLPAFDQGQIPASDQGNTIKSQKFVVPGSSLLLSKLNPRFPRAWIPTVSPLRRAIASTEFLVLLPHHETPREYLYSLYLSSGFMEDFASRVTGTSGSHQRVKPEDLLSMVVVLPPGPLRRAFNDRTGPLLRRVSANRQESLTLATIRDTLLPKLLSGEVRVQEAERELDAVL